MGRKCKALFSSGTKACEVVASGNSAQMVMAHWRILIVYLNWYLLDESHNVSALLACCKKRSLEHESKEAEFFSTKTDCNFCTCPSLCLK